ncbi:MAG TPA: alpha/beta hydrolase [Nocardia sp.]|uniref:alpha/beta fold hydrolase n=1 Tax=Nocardia sp. TaxID=1821 RepID=UPI002B4B1EA7|nr:alpha/beta hydrolase [Nocardia sp.]HLS79206.1 alpha/beta hydrolase [Nocardia sp.]
MAARRARVVAPRRTPILDSGAPAEVVEVRGADGTLLHTEIHGRQDAPTIVLAHGVLCNLTFWRKQIAELSTEFRVVAFDHRGHGLSEQPRRGSYTLDHLADDLHAVLTTTVPAGERAVLAGHSLGGIAVMAWGARYPQDVARRVRAVALVNTTPGEIFDNLHFLRGPERLLGLRRRLAIAVAPLAGIPLPRRLPIRRRLLSYVALGSKSWASVGLELDRMIAATSPRGRGGYGGMLVRMVTAIDPGSLDVPTLVIAGRKDKIAPPARSRVIAESLPRLIELREYDSGHCGPLECAEEVSADLRALARGELGLAADEATA